MDSLFKKYPNTSMDIRCYSGENLLKYNPKVK